MLRLYDAPQQVAIVFAGFETLDVDEDAKSKQLQVNFQETRQLRSVATTV
jgi:hypothetical protein